MRNFIDELNEAREERVSTFNKMIGGYIERGYTFVQSNRDVCKAVFYHHCNNTFQDDIVFVEAYIDPANNKKHEIRTLISRANLLKIAEEVKDIVSNATNDSEE